MTEFEEHKHYRAMYYELLIRNDYRQLIENSQITKGYIETVWIGKREWSDEEIKSKGYGFETHDYEPRYFDIVNRLTQDKPL